jgi:hypothetical protein
MKLTLFNIKQEYLNLVSEIEDNYGEVTDEQAQQLQINQHDLKEKIQNYDEIISAKESFNHRIDEEIDELKRKKYTNQQVINRLKSNMVDSIKVFGTVDTGTYKFTVRKSVLVDVFDKNSIPDRYQKIETVKTPDKLSIKKAIQNGELVSGCELVENYHLKKD